MNNLNFDRQKLVSICKVRVDHDSPFWEAEQPVLWLVAHDLAMVPTTYYQEVAAALGIPYVADLPVHLDDTQSLANVIGPEQLSTLQFFPFIEEDTVNIACADPFEAEKMVAICKEHAPDGTTFKIVIASLATIRNAIGQSLYQTSTARAETNLNFAMPEYSSRGIISPHFRLALFIASVLVLALLAWDPPAGLLLFFALINMAYFILNPVRLLVSLSGMRFKPILISDKQLGNLTDKQLPPYTILVPAKNEASVVPHLIKSLKQIDYPADKLDVKLIVEVDDRETISAYARQGIDVADLADALHTIFQIIKVPVGELSTKPRSCNYALQFARGTMTVIYDAEDSPDPLQLKKAYAALIAERFNTLCVQAKLNFYNAKQNLLTRLFSLEYGFWYDFFLPGLEASHIPLPLGGTSNHFLTGTLRKIGTWDPYNVTEDADIGLRLSQLGYRTTMLDSYTLEEANSQLWNWITQRTRWQKGFLLTTMVHLRHPIRMLQQLGAYGFITSGTLFTANFLLPLLNPVLWIFFILWYVPPLFGFQPIGFTLPSWLETLGAANLILGNGIFILLHVIAAIGKRQWSQLLVVPLLPFYWLLLSIASYRSVVQIITHPYSWEKTRHGLHSS